MNTRFIIVDDDPINNMINKHIISKVFNTTEIKCFQYPAEGLEFISSEYNSTDLKPTILFLDINMPEISGWNFLDEFEKMDELIRKQFIIYIVSSSIDPSDKEKAKDNPFVKDYLSKPLSAAVLGQIVLH